MKKLIYFFGLILLTSTALQAQSEYKSAIGLRFGGTYFDVASLSYKTFMSEKGAIELNLGVRPYPSWFVISVAGAYQHHFDIGAVEGLKWFIGGGAQAYNIFSDFDYANGFGLGVFPTGGVDYKFEKIPLNVSVDTRPTLYLVRDDYWNGFYFGGALAARYTLN